VNQTAGQTDAAPSYPSAAASGRKRESLRHRWRPSDDWQADAAGLEDRPARPSARERASTRASIPRRTAVSSGTRGDSAWISAASVVQGAVEQFHRKLLHVLAQRSARNRNRSRGSGDFGMVVDPGVATACGSWRAAAASPPWPGDGEARGCEDVGGGLGLRRRDFASSLGRG
jgi:hypothetical protein